MVYSPWGGQELDTTEGLTVVFPWMEVGGWFGDDSSALVGVHFVSIIVTSVPPHSIRH